MSASAMAVFASAVQGGGWAKSKHPYYDRRNKYWELNRISYEGGSEYLEPIRYSVEFDEPFLTQRAADGTLSAISKVSEIRTTEMRSMLHRHNREKLWEYHNRNRRARYFNIVKPAVNSCVSHALKKGVVREGDDGLKAFWDEADEDRDSDMNHVMRDALRRANMFGIYWLCVDVRDKALGGDGLPYVYGISPQDIIDWHTDDDGEIQWLKQFIVTEARRTWQEPRREVERFRVWSKTDVIEYELVSGQPIETATRANPLGRVPIEPVFAQRQTDYDFPHGTAFVADLVKVANSIFNHCSLLDEILYKQTFSWLICPDPNGKLDTLQIGLNTAFGYDPGGQGGAPAFISPDADQARVLMEAIGNELEHAKACIGLGRGRSESSKDQASGAALELEGEDKKSILADIASEGQDAEMRLASLVQEYRTGGQGEKPYIAYPKEFDVRGFRQSVDDALAFQRFGVPVGINAQLLKDIAMQRWQGALPPAHMDALIAEVEAKAEADAALPPAGATDEARIVKIARELAHGG